MFLNLFLNADHCTLAPPQVLLKEDKESYPAVASAGKRVFMKRKPKAVKRMLGCFKVAHLIIALKIYSKKMMEILFINYI